MVFAMGLISFEESIYYTAMLLAKAILQDGPNVAPAGSCRFFHEGLMIHKRKIFIMYNDPAGSTKIVSMPYREGEKIEGKSN